MASELVDLIVTPLREYGRKVYKETGRRMKLEVTIEPDLFGRLMAEIDRAYDILQPSVVFFENAVQIVVACKPPITVHGPATFTFHDLDKPAHHGTVSAEGARASLLDEEERGDG